ncbi:MAG TPA: asparagine synthase (glutamine-hydrolyzing), partial [Candidatus Paceibacterota bacterium]
MCGIIAIYGDKAKEIESNKIDVMLACLEKRGPDKKSYLKEDKIILGQTRLSIVDIESGHQPMKDNKHPYTITFNGEIYRYKDLKKDLENKGHIFSTNSDTEVILKAYTEYGDRCVEYLDGMFAFAIWNDEKKELFIARDRFGKKPFYYCLFDKTFFAASEIKAIFSSNLIKGKIDTSSLDDYLRLMYIPPNKTIYSNMYTLPPAHAGIVKDGDVKKWNYWRLEKKENKIPYDEAKEKIKELFDEAIKKRMVADVEIGSLLSGGVDSTLVTLYANKYSSGSIKTFSLGYEGNKSELPYALYASKKIETDHYTLNTDRNDIGELRNIIDYMDEPHADSSDFPQHLISKLASSKVRVALSGDGADELFMGYGWYQKYWHIPVYKRLFTNPFSVYKKMVEVFSKKERERILKKVSGTSDSNNKKELEISKKSKGYFDQINLTDLSIYLPGQLLTKVDRTSMMHSLEIRSPFLDTALVEFVYNLPIEYKLDKNNNKIILKDILTETMPKDFVYRRKQGFG